MSLINILYCLSLLGIVYGLQPSCSTCKFYIPHARNPDLGLCKIFQDSVYINHKPVLVKNLAIYCRNDEHLCGRDGFLYEPMNTHSENTTDVKPITYKNENIRNLCCSEFKGDGTLDELEQLEKDLIDIFQRMRKHNTMKIYKTSKSIYNLITKYRY